MFLYAAPGEGLGNTFVQPAKNVRKKYAKKALVLSCRNNRYMIISVKQQLKLKYNNVDFRNLGLEIENW